MEKAGNFQTFCEFKKIRKENKGKAVITIQGLEILGGGIIKDETRKWRNVKELRVSIGRKQVIAGIKEI